MTWSALIVDDEPHIREELKFALSDNDKIHIIGEADNAFDAICGIQQLKPDIVFLDIMLGSIDGIALAKQIINLGLETNIIIVTAFDNYALTGYELNAVDYVLKPFTKDRLARAIDKVMNRNAGQRPDQAGKNTDIEKSKRIVAKKKDNWKLLNVNEVYYFYCREHTVCAETLDDTYTLNITLRTLEQQLDKTSFIRTHKSYIVNINYINEIIPWFNYTYKVTMKHKKSEIPISRNYMKPFKSTLRL